MIINKISTLVLSSVLILPAFASSENEKNSYLIYLNPFVVQNFASEAVSNGFSYPKISDKLKYQDKIEFVAKNIKEFKYSPGVEAVKDALTRNYGLKNVGETADLIPAFYAVLSSEEYKNIEGSDFVSHIEIAAVKEDEVVTSSCVDICSDVNDAGEIIPWAKQEVRTDDNKTATTPFYMVDRPLKPLALATEINLNHSENRSTTYSNHPAVVMSIVGGRANGARTRGINPNQPIVHIGATSTIASTVETINYAAFLAETVDDFATLNISMNSGVASPTQANNPFGHNKDIGRAMRRASSRFLVTQSAGNNDKNACIYSFGYNGTPQENDAIFVVSGTNELGERYQQTPNSADFYNEPRANYGPCVEAWAPGRLMASSSADGTVKSPTGTSFSAPIVAAIAARYGDNTTRPIERDAYVRGSLFDTGYNDGAASSNLPIKQISYTAPQTHSIPKKLNVNAVYSETNSTNLALLTDNKFYSEIFWNAGANWGSVVIDLGSLRKVSGVRLHIRSSAANGQLDFAIHGGNSISLSGPGTPSIPANPIAYKSVNDQYDMIPYYIPLTGFYRYLMIEGNNYNSWLAYSELEVYGQ